ncbi:DUF1707 SHOCT-like domain-containing protein [Subtercola boreus]|uniref:DUF1707 domain-containing protein n=1 Tax=Subtercola boreus TaxID=120213 RepID=A0A3E0WEH6_9MICO|nr:DUF1707 domain-containing protein [Subtercola boreus]RFA22513.1 hypothetical protein B7R24_02500 [Subtercola boreus]RFA22869.1 hypothetical protein B7R23_02495 [Subtercola boreus]RFA28621.1 hypothetical protein B7R25_02510 [Subtercola boreus]
MTDQGAYGGAVRLSNAERDRAVARLNANQRDGRLSAAEFDERVGAVRSAVTQADLEPIFRDLPQDDRQSEARPAEFAPAALGYGASAKAIPDPQARRGPLGGRLGTVAVSLSPLVATVLFFITSALVGWNFSWLWFLLVPVTGAIVYAAGTRDSDRDRDPYRDPS